MQVVAPSGLYVPAGQIVNVLPDAVGQEYPAGHVNLPPLPCAEGLLLPVYNMLPPAPAGGPGQYSPAAQLVHAEALAVLDWPAGQYMQPAAPFALYVPAGQVRHDAELVELVFGLYVPALQREQMPAVASLYEPAAHAVMPLEP